MESQLIPIKDLQIGDFYDIQSSDESPRVLGALLLEQLPNNRAKLMLMNSSDFDHFTTTDTQIVLAERSLQIETMQLGLVYPYQTFTRLPSKILQWPNNYEGEELITQIKEEMRRAMSGRCWVLRLPHFCEGYLQLYRSYLRCKVNSPERRELAYLWFEFLGSFFSVIRDHILRVKVLSEEKITGLLKVMKEIDQISETNWEIWEGAPNPLITVKTVKLAEIKKSCFDSYRPIELSLGSFNGLWELIVQEYHQDLITWQLQQPLSLHRLFLTPEKLIGIISRSRDLARDMLDVDVAGLDSEEVLRVKFRVAVAAQSLHLADGLIEHAGIATEEKLAQPVLTSCSEKLEDLVMTRAELVPSVLAYLKSILRGTIQLSSLLKCATARIAVEDWQFVTFLINHNSFQCTTIRNQKRSDKTSNKIKELVQASLEHQLSAELLKDLLPCVDYGNLVFPALAESISLPGCREAIMIYVRSGHFQTNLNSPKDKETLLRFWMFLTARIAIEDWELVTLLIHNVSFSQKNRPSFDDQICEYIKELVYVALEHQMKAELLKSLLPFVNYGHLVFPALAERISLPSSKETIMIYFRLEHFYIDPDIPKDKERLIEFWKFLADRITIEDWEIVSFFIQNQTFTLKNIHSVDEKICENVKNLVRVSLEHKMSVKLLKDLLPCANYGYLLFPMLIEWFPLPHCREVMLFYFRSGHCHTEIKSPEDKERLINFWKFLTYQIAMKDWELVAILIQNVTFSLKDWHSLDDQMCKYVKNLVKVALEQNMRAELLKDLFPCNNYGHMVLAALVEKFAIPHSRLMMLTYFKDEFSLSHIKNYWDKDTFCTFLRFLTTKTASEDWEILTFVHRFETFTVATQHSFINDQKVYEQVADLVKVALEHTMSVELLIDLLPSESYGHLVFPALVEGFSIPHSRVMMLNYFKSEISLTHIKYYWDKDRFCSFLKALTTRVAEEDWEILSFVNRFETFTVAIWLSLVNDQQVYEAVKEIVRVALEHNMSAELLRNLFPYKDYGHLVFPAFAKGFSRARSFQKMISYYGSEFQCIEFAREMVQTEKRGKKDVDKRIARYLQGEKLDLWYVIGGSAQIQFIWMKQSSPGFIKRLSPGLAREVCSYLA